MFTSESMVLGVLSDDAFVMVNKKLARSFGFLEAGLLGEFISTYRYVKKEGHFYKNGELGPWFFLTQPSVEKNLGIKRDSFDTAVKNLVRYRVLVKKRMGLPAKNFYMLDWDKIVGFLAENPPETAPQSDCGKPADLNEGSPRSSAGDSRSLDVGKPAVIKKNLEKEIYKKNSTKVLEEEGPAPLVPKPSERSIKFQSDFSYSELETATRFLVPQMLDTWLELDLDLDFQNRLVCYMAMGKLKYFSASEFRRINLEIERAGGKDSKGRPIKDRAMYIVKGIILSGRMGSDGDSFAYHRERAKKLEAENRKKREMEAQRPSVPFYNWLEN